MSSVSQEQRLLRVETPLGDDAFILSNFNGTEGISELFSFSLSLLSHTQNIQAKDIVGHTITVKINSGQTDKPPRLFNGFVNHMVARGMTGEGLRQYQISIVPSLWLLTKSEHNRIFQNLNSIDIIQQVLADFSSEIDFELNVKPADYLKRETCTQYRESDFNFISRLMEEEGIFYYFRHEEKKNVMVICDSNKGFVDSEPKAMRFNDTVDSQAPDLITEWIQQYAYHAGAFHLTDYNHAATTVDFTESTKTKTDLPKLNKLIQTEHAYFNYEKGDELDSHKFDKTYNKMLTDRLMEGEETTYNNCSGKSLCRGFHAGARFELEHPIKSESGKYLLVRVNHGASAGNKSTDSYYNSFTAMPESVPFRPAQKAVRTRALGPQTAVVTETNQKRCVVKVKYFWTDAPSDCWVRVSQLMTGTQENEETKQFVGMAQFVPSVGEEVIVDFLQGDMDRPIVKGSVYNSSQVASGTEVGEYGNFAGFESTHSGKIGLYDVADKKAVIFSSADGFYAKGKEWARIKSDESIEILSEGTKEEKIKKRRTTNIGQTDKLKVGGERIVDVDKSIEITAGQDMAYTAGMEFSCTSGTGMSHTAGTDMAFEAGTGIKLKTGMSSIEMTPSSIELKVGGNSIKIDPAGVTIKGLQVKIDGSVTTAIKGGAMTQVESGGITTLKGSLLMIN